MSLLEVTQLNAGYGDFQALFDINVSVTDGETVAMIGANGAGKSTLMRTISGLIRPMSGSLSYDGSSLQGMRADKRVAAGISLVPEGRRIFPSLSVDENLRIGGYLGRKGPWNRTLVYETFPFLSRLSSRSGARLSGGEQQALAIGRALMANPRLLLLDEVSLGLAPIVVKQVYEAIPAIKQHGTAVLIVEQDVNQALSVADRVYCLLEGRIALAGAPTELTQEQITAAYFGLGQLHHSEEKRA